MAYVPNSGSVVAFQGNPSVLQVLATVTNPGGFSGSVISFPTGNQSVSGTVGASLIGQLPGGTAVIGSVATLQGTNPWLVSFGNSSIIAVNANQSVSGTVGASIVGQLPAGTAVLGSVAALQGTNPWIVNFANSSIIAINAGSVFATQSGTWRTSVVSSTPSSMLVGASIFGQLPAGTAPIGSVATLQGTNPWIVNFQNSSILSVPTSSTIVVFQAPSIVGTYSEDSAHTTADKGFFVMGVRNDTVASFTGSNGEYNPFAHDSAGRVLAKPFAAEEARIEGYNSVVSTSVTTLVAAAGAGLRNYITDLWVANTGATTTLITFRSGGGTSVLGYTIAPTAGGSNLIGLQTPIRTQANETFDFQATSSSSILFVTVKGYKGP